MTQTQSLMFSFMMGVTVMNTYIIIRDHADLARVGKCLQSVIKILESMNEQVDSLLRDKK